MNAKHSPDLHSSKPARRRAGENSHIRPLAPALPSGLYANPGPGAGIFILRVGSGGLVTHRSHDYLPIIPTSPARLSVHPGGEIAKVVKEVDSIKTNPHKSG